MVDRQDKPVWVVQALEELVQEQILAKHIEESNSLWNSSVVFCLKEI